MPRPSTTTKVPISADMIDRLERACQVEDRSPDEVVREALARYFDGPDSDRFHAPALFWRQAAGLSWTDAVARRAYERSEQRGTDEGNEVTDWRQSEQDLDTRKGDRRSEARPLSGADRRSGEDRRRAGAQA